MATEKRAKPLPDCANPKCQHPPSDHDPKYAVCWGRNLSVVDTAVACNCRAFTLVKRELT